MVKYSLKTKDYFKLRSVVVVVVYHVTIVGIGHGLFKKFWPMVIGCEYALQEFLYLKL